jgi:putative membrane protein
MVEHMVMWMVAPPLILKGLPAWLLRAVLEPIMPLVRIATRPLVALVVINTVIAALHVPVVVELMSTNDLLHLLDHTVLIAASFLMWWPVLDPIPEMATLAPFGKMGYLFLQSLVPTIPASFLTLGSEPLYGIYETFPRLWGIDAMTDQVVAGLIMKIGGGLILWAVIAWVFFSWAAQEQRSEPPPLVVPRSEIGIADAGQIHQRQPRTEQDKRANTQATDIG